MAGFSLDNYPGGHKIVIWGERDDFSMAVGRFGIWRDSGLALGGRFDKEKKVQLFPSNTKAYGKSGTGDKGSGF